MFNRNFILIILSSIVLGAPMPMLILLGALAGQELAPIAALATVPASVQMLAGILVAMPISLYMGRAGRRPGFAIGAVCMIAGGLLAALSLSVKNFYLLCLAHLILGTAFIAFNFFRFAAAESVGSQFKARAISYTLASGLVAALVGPLIYTQFRDALLPIPFAGAYVALACLGALGCIPLALMQNTSPAPATSPQTNEQKSKRQILTRPVVLLAILSAIVAQAAMVLMMIPTPLAMESHGHAGHHGADVIRWHVIAMFAPSFFTGSLIQRFSSIAVISVGFALLILAGLVAAMGDTLTFFYLSLVLLGVGWNFGFIGGTYLLQSAVSESERPVIQGVNDTILAIASSVASLSAGALYAGFGWRVIALATISALVTILVLLILAGKSSATSAIFRQH